MTAKETTPDTATAAFFSISSMTEDESLLSLQGASSNLYYTRSSRKSLHYSFTYFPNIGVRRIGVQRALDGHYKSFFRSCFL